MSGASLSSKHNFNKLAINFPTFTLKQTQTQYNAQNYFSSHIATAAASEEIDSLTTE